MNPSNNQTKSWIAIVVVVALVSAGVAALLVNIFERKQEAKNPYLKLVEVTDETTDPQPWGVNFPRQYDGYLKTKEPTRTNFGGGEALPAEKAEANPWLTRMFAGYAFSLDYRDRRGHAYMLLDQEKTRRVNERPQPGACLHCHSSIIPAYRYVGLKAGAKPEDAVQKGFEEVNAMKYKDAHMLVDDKGKNLVQHPVSCVDCHDPKTMALRVSRPGFMNGIRDLKAHQGIPNYDPNRDASRQEMRTFVCAQCHVEYYFKGDKKTLTYPWANGLKLEEIEKYYDDIKFTDWKHTESGAPILKAQHPEFELYSQGVHARSGVACADCHMPYTREGALKVSDHWVRSPLLNINRACQTCHHYTEQEIKARVDTIQGRNNELMQRAAAAMTDYLDAIKPFRAPVMAKVKAQLEPKFKAENTSEADQRKQLGDAIDAEWQKVLATSPDLQKAMDLHRKGQWRLDYIAAENSMGFHAPQEAARILGEAADYFRQAHLAVQRAAATRK